MGGEPMVSYSTGALTSLLDKLAKPKNHPMLTEDFSKLIEDLHQDLKSLKKDLLDKFEGRRGTDEQVKVWMKQVRELVFDMEDWIDQKPVTVDMWESEREEIEGFKTQIKQAIERCRRYGLLNKAPTDPVPAHVLVPNNTAIESQRLLCEEKPGLVALDRPKSEIVEHLTDTEHKKLKVVSIVGMEGLGKTTLAKEIYSDLQGQYDFDCRAFATVGRRPSLRATLQDILRQVKPKTHRQDTKGSSDVQQVIKPKTHPHDTKGSSDVQQVITELWEYLATKRYFILIDDISSTWAWKVINCALPDKNLGSRVLTTTCIIDIAKSCCIHPGDFVYQMEPLSEKDSRSLFLQKLVREEVSDNMLQMCGGKPLAINVATGLLNRRSSELAEPKMLGKCILSSSNQYTTSEGMTKILHMSYADLSVPVKSCFLYLSIFPKDYMIKKDSLIRLWRAEGFIPRRGEGGRDEESLWVTGESYFNELISRRLIQPVFDYDDEKAVRCTVHGIILDFIASLSSQENFVTEGAELRSGQFPCDTIRRFSLDCYGDQDEDDTLASCAGHLSRVRSLAVFGDIEGIAGRSALTVLGYIGGTSILPSLKLIRVLDLEDTNNLRSRHLQGIEGLVLLRYLGLGGTAIDTLPEDIGELEQLETLDVRQTKLSTLPASIVRLKRLVCLLLDGAVELPKDIWELQGLEEVSTIGANSSSSLDSVSELLRKSEQLRVLSVRLDGLHRSDDKSVMSFLVEVARSTKLRSLSLGCLDVDLLGLLLEVPPCQLRRFELEISGPIPGGAVNKMASLVSLTHMDIEISELEAGLIRILGDLPNLVLLKLVSSEIPSPSGKSRCNIIGEDGFRCLKVFSFKCKVGGMGLEFTSGAMPQLRRLWIVFSARETLSLYGNFDFGIEHLSSLTRVHATINCKSARAWEVKDAEAAIRQQVRKLPIEPTIEFSTTHIHKMLAGEKRETTISLRDRVKMMISSSDSAASVHGGGRQAAAAGGAVVQLGSSTNRLDVALRKIKSFTLLLARVLPIISLLLPKILSAPALLLNYKHSMAIAWDVARIGWGITVLGWLLSPIISLLLPKILSFLGFDASQKLQELEIHTVPELKRMLREVEEQRMLTDAKKEASIRIILDKLAAMLKHALYEAEDILDLVEYHRIEREVVVGSWLQRWVEERRMLREAKKEKASKKSMIDIELAAKLRAAMNEERGIKKEEVVGDGESHSSSWPHRLYGAVATSRLGRWVHFIRSGSAQLMQWTHRSGEPLPVSAAPSDEPPPVSTAPLDSLGQWLRRWFSSLDFNYCCTSIFNWLVVAIEVARYHRNWSYDVVGITSYQENAAAASDSVLPASSRWYLKRRIEKVESTVSEVKKSPLLSVASKSSPDDIVNKERSKIRSARNWKVFGREVLRDDIMAKLRETPHGDAASSSSTTCYSVIGIVGVAGSGKTTMAQYIREYIEEYEKELFDTIMCIHVSETFIVDDIFHEMLKDITGDPYLNIKDGEILQAKLKKKLKGKRFFLILDDIWVENKNGPQLQELLSPLNVGKKASKILVTARTKHAARALCADEPIKMPDLDKEQYLSMFMYYALDGAGVDDHKFVRIGKKIAEKLQLSPIAAKTVAAQLRGQPYISFWETTAKLDVLNDTRGALWWSYQQLNADTRRCFELCSIFPRRLQLEKNELVRMWIAQGFVKTSCATEDMEDVAEGYFQELLSCSFLQPTGTSANTKYFTIHDLLHDLAYKVAGSDCFRIENARSQKGEGWKGDVPRDARHLFVQNYDEKLITEKILELENLRTLIICTVGRGTPVEEKVIGSIFKRLPKLRVVAIAFSRAYGASIEKPEMLSVPESISQLKHLRYLAFRTSFFCWAILPSTLAKLYHMELLDFGQCKDLKLSAGNLINLRYVFSGAGLEILNISRVTSLRTLPYFRVKKEQGYEVKQLRDLNKLSGTLRIYGLENVESKEEALEANLGAKGRLTRLKLSWDGGLTSCSPQVEAEVFEGLCPPVGLEILDIKGYEGSRYPNWMVGKQNGSPKDLQKLGFNRCSQLRSARELAAFIHLHTLVVMDCSWDTLPGNMEHLTSLKDLAILQCWNIRSLPTLPQFLEKFHLIDCNYELSESCQTVGHPNWQKIEHIPEKFIFHKGLPRPPPPPQPDW